MKGLFTAYLRWTYNQSSICKHKGQSMGRRRMGRQLGKQLNKRLGILLGQLCIRLERLCRQLVQLRLGRQQQSWQLQHEQLVLILKQ